MYIVFTVHISEKQVSMKISYSCCYSNISYCIHYIVYELQVRWLSCWCLHYQVYLDLYIWKSYKYNLLFILPYLDHLYVEVTSPDYNKIDNISMKFLCHMICMLCWRFAYNFLWYNLYIFANYVLRVFCKKQCIDWYVTFRVFSVTCFILLPI